MQNLGQFLVQLNILGCRAAGIWRVEQDGLQKPKFLDGEGYLLHD